VTIQLLFRADGRTANSVGLNRSGESGGISDTVLLADGLAVGGELAESDRS